MPPFKEMQGAGRIGAAKPPEYSQFISFDSPDFDRA